MVACSVETYSVVVDSPEVKQGSLALQLDASDSEYVLRVVVQLDTAWQCLPGARRRRAVVARQ